MADIRKVQRTPSGTFFVCIPKAWAKNHGLKRGAVVSVSETAYGRLLIDPEYGVERSPRTITLNVGPYLSREIVGKYLLGFDVIRVEAEKRISFEARDIVKKTVGRLIGLEIVEEDYSRIVLQCLLDPSGFPPEKILRRGYAIAAGMHHDIVDALVGGNMHLAKSVIARDEEVNRLYFLLVRILRTIVQNPSLSEKLGVRPIECLDYRLVASLVEAIGDECVRVALKVVELEDFEFSVDLKRLFLDFQRACSKGHEKALKAFFIGDVDGAENVRNMRENLDEISSNIERVTRAQSLDVVPHILAVASILRQIYEHSVDIADLAMPRKT